jgi:hypothetical protein
VSETPILGIEPRARDALAVLAYVFLQFGRAGDAASLLHVLALNEREPGWAATTRCVALMMDGQAAAAREEAERLLSGSANDTHRCQLLRVLARACWSLGLEEEARAHQEAMCELLTATVMQRNGVPRG